MDSRPMFDIIHDLRVALWALRNDHGWQKIRVAIVWPVAFMPGLDNTLILGAIFFQRFRIHLLIPYEIEFCYFMASLDIEKKL